MHGQQNIKICTVWIWTASVIERNDTLKIYLITHTNTCAYFLHVSITDHLQGAYVVPC